MPQQRSRTAQSCEEAEVIKRECGLLCIKLLDVWQGLLTLGGPVRSSVRPVALVVALVVVPLLVVVGYRCPVPVVVVALVVVAPLLVVVVAAATT